MPEVANIVSFGFIPGPWEWVLILAIALIIFGPGKLPEVGRSLGKTIREFREETKKGDRTENSIETPTKGDGKS